MNCISRNLLDIFVSCQVNHSLPFPFSFFLFILVASQCIQQYSNRSTVILQYYFEKSQKEKLITDIFCLDGVIQGRSVFIFFVPYNNQQTIFDLPFLFLFCFFNLSRYDQPSYITLESTKPRILKVSLKIFAMQVVFALFQA